MADSFVQLPDDATNTGKKIRTVTRTVGLNEVHEHFFIIQDPVNDVQLRVYQEGDTAATVAGFATLMEIAANELRPLQGSVADGLLVNLGANNDISGTVTANAGVNLNTSLLALESGGNLAAAVTSLAIIDDWDETDRAKVNIIVGQAGVQGGSGTVSSNTQRVVLATDVALPSGANTIGAVTTARTSLTASSPTFATVGVASAAAVASNGSRKGLILTNTSTAVISFGIGAAAVLNSGITLLPYGVWEMDEYTFSTGVINAIASAAASNLAIQELT